MTPPHTYIGHGHRSYTPRGDPRPLRVIGGPHDGDVIHVPPTANAVRLFDPEVPNYALCDPDNGVPQDSVHYVRTLQWHDPACDRAHRNAPRPTEPWPCITRGQALVWEHLDHGNLTIYLAAVNATARTLATWPA